MANRNKARNGTGSAKVPGQVQAVASSEQLGDMEAAMIQLEEMLREIGDVSAVIEFNAMSTGQPPGISPDRGHFRAAGSGAVVLAQQVGEDLRKWHEKNEKNVAQYSAEHGDRLKKCVAHYAAEQESREQVRTAVRHKLYELAESTLAQTIASVTKADKKRFVGKGMEVGNASEAIANLETRLTAATNPILDRRGEPPFEMLIAGRAARWAVDQRRLRSNGRRTRLPELDIHLDRDLMTESEECMGQRKVDLIQQRDLQLKTLTRLEESQMSRQATNDAFDEVVKVGYSASDDYDPWPNLCPAALAKDHPAGPDMAMTPPAFRKEMAMPQLGYAMEQAISATLTPQLMSQGVVRCRDLQSDFYQSYLAKDSGERARMVGNELEKWQLSAKIELLRELLSMSQETHSGIMDQLRRSLQFKDDDPTDHLQRTLMAAKEFHRQRQKFFDEQVEAAETSVSEFCAAPMKQLTTLRRRTELASLKRWNDVSAGLGASSDNAWMRCQFQLAGEVRKTLAEVHKHVQLPVENLDIERGRKTVDLLSVAWKRCTTPVPSQLSFLESLTKSLPDTIESCAVTKAAITNLEVELERICVKLQQFQNVEDDQ